ncbi:MAG: lysophospholipid acyltransferase family protein [Thermoplasmatota archaeon]
MTFERRRARLRLVEWPSPDWYRAHWGYRAIKYLAEPPIARLARVEIRGRENLPATGSVLLAANHFTWADPIVVGIALDRPAFYLAKERLFRNPLMGGFLSAMGQVKVDRTVGGNDGAISKALDILRLGLVLGVFPEATRSRYGEIKRGKTGIARLALLSGAPVLPVALTTYEFWPKHRALPKIGPKVYVNIGKPLQLKGAPADAEDRARVREATDEVMGEIRRLLAEAEAARERGEKWGR